MIIKTTFVKMWVVAVKIMSLESNISSLSPSLSTRNLTLNSASSRTPLPTKLLYCPLCVCANICLCVLHPLRWTFPYEFTMG